MASERRGSAAVLRVVSEYGTRDGLPVAEKYDFLAGDGVPLRLTRYAGGTKGPVLLVHGAGVWSGMFMLPTLKENFVQYLVRHGYDTWVLDWRASVQLPLRQFSLDDAADYDMPAAVRRMREITGAESVQAVVHCAGSAAFFMSLAAGHLPDVRSVVASQVALHHDVPKSTRFKALLRVPELLDLGLDSLTSDDATSTPLFQAAFSKVSGFLRMECDSPVCHRISFMYGRLYRHSRLNRETHSRLEEQFGRCNLMTFRHLGQMARVGHAVRYDHGRAGNLLRYGQARPPDYLDPAPFKRPITFISGEKNQTYLPSSTERTFAWLSEANGARYYQRHVLPGCGHIDTFMGSTASEDTYPVLRDALEFQPRAS
ncbi:alpha/beta fold hydrolase [Corallococcus sp. bb12-1]|uniref:alpha/beta fold hydrolase n=1 Tax=Corallococcus sp. bb12-1 TaxID=2996784 RepID=UPI00226E8805|nr:alpha/beta fold hydrolase [Corallococcus sp. bb12-1]MCY1043096.1 alpha/beta fold hydrolase [Corallococcus sp. bb12-1]